jgi:hypothetical protein
MQGFIGFWKWLATPRSANAGTTQALLEPNADEARFGEQLRRLYQSLEEANARERSNSRGNRPRQRAHAVGSEIVRPV